MQHYPVSSSCHWAGCRDQAGQVQGWTPLREQASMSQLRAHTRGKGDHSGGVGAGGSLSEPILPEKSCREEGHPPFLQDVGLIKPLTEGQASGLRASRTRLSLVSWPRTRHAGWCFDSPCVHLCPRRIPLCPQRAGDPGISLPRAHFLLFPQ